MDLVRVPGRIEVEVGAIQLRRQVKVRIKERNSMPYKTIREARGSTSRDPVVARPLDS